MEHSRNKSHDKLRCLRRDGFVELSDVFSDHELHLVETLLDRLFVSNPGAKTVELRPQQVWEIPRTIRKVPKLRESIVFLRCQSLASEWLGSKARYTFDHVIYKCPGTESEVHWHQDQAYQKLDLDMRSIHFWIPLKTMGVDNGGLQFVVGSHRLELLDHHKVDKSRTLAIEPADDWIIHTSMVYQGGLSAHLPRTIHRSTNNQTNRVRKAWILHFSAYGKMDILRPLNLVKHLQRWNPIAGQGFRKV